MKGSELGLGLGGKRRGDFSFLGSRSGTQEILEERNGCRRAPSLVAITYRSSRSAMSAVSGDEAEVIVTCSEAVSSALGAPGLFRRVEPVPAPFIAQHLKESLLDEDGYLNMLKSSIERRAAR